jgi:hypothetical protein
MDPFADKRNLKMYGCNLDSDVRVPFMGAVTTSLGEGGFLLTNLFGVNFYLVPPVSNDSMAARASLFPCWSIEKVSNANADCVARVLHHSDKLIMSCIA